MSSVWYYLRSIAIVANRGNYQRGNMDLLSYIFWNMWTVTLYLSNIGDLLGEIVDILWKEADEKQGGGAREVG